MLLGMYEVLECSAESRSLDAPIFLMFLRLLNESLILRVEKIRVEQVGLVVLRDWKGVCRM